jgi:hypothetical protein
VNLGLRVGAYLRRMQKAARRGLLGGRGTVDRCRTAAIAAYAGLGGCERDDAPGCCGTAPAADRPAAARCPQVCGAAAAQAKPSGELPVRRRVRTEIGFGSKERESGGETGRERERDDCGWGELDRLGHWDICWADGDGREATVLGSIRE